MNKLPTEDENKSEGEGGNEDEDEDESLPSSITKLGFLIKAGLDLALLLLHSFIHLVVTGRYLIPVSLCL
jgi:hypothetical protein